MTDKPDEEAGNECVVPTQRAGQARRAGQNRTRDGGALRDLGRHHRQGALVGPHQRHQPLLPNAIPKLGLDALVHVGLMMRVRSRESRAGEDEPTPFDEVFRRQNQASDLIDRAVEAEHFQAVGMQLRECFISLVGAVRRRVELGDGERPQDANVTAWTGLLWDQLCPGDPNKELRQYLKTTSEKAWQLVNWLTHHRNANKTAALIANEAVNTLVMAFNRVLSRDRHDRTEQCPRCASRDLRTYFDPALEPDGEYYEVCAGCTWTSHPA